MPLTKEELLKPRWKCIADYPDNTNEIGCILDRDWCRYRNDDEDSGEVVWRISDFPHLFQKLPWWSDRKPEDLSEYVKNKNYGSLYSLRVDYTKNSMWLDDCEFTLNLKDYEPATPDEYTAYINQKQQ